MLEKIRKYVELQSQLKEFGVVAVDGTSIIAAHVRVHMKEKKLIKLNGGTDGLTFENRDCEKYPYQISLNKEGVEFFCIVTKKAFLDNFGYEAVQLLESQLVQTEREVALT